MTANSDPRRSSARILLASLLVALLAACSGGGGGGSGGAAPLEDGATLENVHGRLVIDESGRVESLTLTSDPTELASTGVFLEADRLGATVPASSLKSDGDDLVVRFEGVDGKVRLRVTREPGHFLFRVREAAIDDLDALRIRIPVRISGVSDAPLNGRYDDVSAACLRPVTANAHAAWSAADGVLDLTVEWVARHGIAGGAAALVAVPRDLLLDAMGDLETAEGLPSPRLDGVRARESAATRESYLFLTYYAPGDIDAVIEYAKVGGFGTILVLRDIWRRTGGTYAIEPSKFPGGLAEFAQVCERIRAAGLRVGLHLYGPSISLDDPLITPVPAEGLLTFPCPPLAAGVDAGATTLTLEGPPDLPADGGGGFPGRYVLVGDEIVRYASRSATAPWVLTGCERGALGTTAAPHAGGASVGHLATLWSMFLIDPDGPLVETVSANLAAVVNEVHAEFVYFDGSALIPVGRHVDRWYYMNRLLPAHAAAFDHPVLVQTGMGPGRQLAWHLVPRSASADGHGDIKAYLDQRMTTIESIRRGLNVPDVGWYGFDEGRPPDHLEYIAARCLGWECALSLQTYRSALERDPRAREIMEMLGRHERCKTAGGLPESVLGTLPTPGVDTRLLEAADGTWHLFRADYVPEEPIPELEGGDHHSWKVTNPEAYNRTVGVEITRGSATRVDAPIDEPGHLVLDEFESVAPYATGGSNDFTRLVNRTDPFVSAQGIARVGVTHDLALSDDAPVGVSSIELSTDNQSVGTGWCAVGRRFSTPLDLTGMPAIGLMVHGDGRNTTLRVELWDDDDVRVQLRASIHFTGWRRQTWALKPPSGFDASRVRYVVFILSDLPLKGPAAVKLDALRALPIVRPAASLAGAVLKIGAREVVLPADLPAGGSVRIDALGRLTLWPGGMEAGQTWILPDGPIRIGTGTRTAWFTVADPDTYAGDVAVRVSFLDVIHPK